MDSYFLLFNKTTATEFSPAAQRNPPFIPLYKGGKRGIWCARVILCRFGNSQAMQVSSMFGRIAVAKILRFDPNKAVPRLQEMTRVVHLVFLRL
jgi:hypothetical protein